MKKKQLNNPNESAFLGLFEGKRKAAKAEAEIKLIAANKEKELALLKAKQEAAAAGYKTDEEKKAEAEITTAELESSSSITLYYIIGGIVAAALIALYFIKKR